MGAWCACRRAAPTATRPTAAARGGRGARPPSDRRGAPLPSPTLVGWDRPHAVVRTKPLVRLIGREALAAREPVRACLNLARVEAEGREEVVHGHESKFRSPHRIRVRLALAAFRGVR